VKLLLLVSTIVVVIEIGIEVLILRLLPFKESLLPRVTSRRSFFCHVLSSRREVIDRSNLSS
jgi:hypothetical protein